ncbi:MAG: FAD-binding protein [Patescibacteria group bacterium]
MDVFSERQAQLVKLIGRGLKSHVSLKDELAFGVGGVADFFIKANTLDLLIRSIGAAQDIDSPFLIVGQGSQTLFSDYGFPGLVIVNRTERIEFVPAAGHVLVDAGVTWPAVILQAASRGFGGFESLLLADGSVGGSLMQNRLSPMGLAPYHYLRGATVMAGNGTISRLKQSPKKGQILLVASLQLVQTRRDELLRRIRRFEDQRRRFKKPGRRWLGPVFHSDFQVADSNYLSSHFQSARVLNFSVGGAVFSEERPNYIEARGRVTARAVRELVEQVYERLLARAPTESITCSLKFVGSWGDERDARN